ncbi:hypothetical protein GCM10020256_16840 [Streptomyces thermocoprophilus]
MLPEASPLLVVRNSGGRPLGAVGVIEAYGRLRYRNRRTVQQALALQPAQRKSVVQQRPLGEIEPGQAIGQVKGGRGARI